LTVVCLTGLTTAILLGSSDAGLAQSERAARPATPEMAQLWSFFGGDWTTTEALERSEELPNGGARRGQLHYRLGQGGRTLIGEGQSDGSAGRLEYLMVMWWNPGTRFYGFFICFNGGASACEERGTAHWDGDRLINEYTALYHGKRTRMTDTWQHTGRDTCTLVLAVEQDDGTMRPMITTTSVRR